MGQRIMTSQRSMILQRIMTNLRSMTIQRMMSQTVKTSSQSQKNQNHQIIKTGAMIIFMECQKSEVDQIMKGIQLVKPWIDKSYADWDKNLHKKWFGTVNDGGLSDRQVFHRFKRAYDFMYEDEPRWEVMCCDQAIGGCTSCQRGVLAYVTYWYTPGNRDSHRKNVHIRLCPSLFNTEDATEVIGITMFHEVMHITSHAGDSCYSKKDCYNLARTNPSRARLNANSYTLFAIEGGAPRDDYERLMDLWGGSLLKEGCSDYRYNCWEMAKKIQM